MTMQIQKPAAKKQDQLTANGKTSVLTKEEIEAVDELAALEKQIAPVRPLIKRFDEVKKLLCSVEPAKLVGTTGVVEFKEASFPREITDMHGLIGMMKQKMGGYEPLLDVLKINLGDVDKYLTEAESAKFIGTGEAKRTIKAVRTKGE